MKKIVFFLVLFLIVFQVKAASLYTVEGTRQNYSDYLDATEKLKNSDCNKELYNNDDVDKCNSLKLQKAKSLTYLFNAQEYNAQLITNEMKNILDENKDNCKTAINDDIKELINNTFKMFLIAGPILVILFGTYDFFKSVIAGDAEKMSKFKSDFFKRAIALVLLFMSPALVNSLVGLLSKDKKNSNYYTCSFTSSSLTISYTPVTTASKTVSGTVYNSGLGSISVNNDPSTAVGSATLNTYDHSQYVQLSLGDTETANKIVSSAKAVNKVTSAKNWKYYKGSSFLGTLSNYQSNRKSVTNCAAYVSTALYLSGAFSKSEIQSMGKFNKKNCTINEKTGKKVTPGDITASSNAPGVQNFLFKHGWIRITDPKKLAAGDIVLTKPTKRNTCNAVSGGHVEIYAGNNSKYNAGNTDHIRKMGPHKVNYSKSKTKFIEAYRAPLGWSSRNK